MGERWSGAWRQLCFVPAGAVVHPLGVLAAAWAWLAVGRLLTAAHRHQAAPTEAVALLVGGLAVALGVFVGSALLFRFVLGVPGVLATVFAVGIALGLEALILGGLLLVLVVLNPLLLLLVPRFGVGLMLDLAWIVEPPMLGVLLAVTAVMGAIAWPLTAGLLRADRRRSPGAEPASDAHAVLGR